MTVLACQGRALLADGYAEAPIAWTPYGQQGAVVSIEKGIVLAAGAVGGGKSEPCSLLLLMWALANPRRADGRPTKWYAIGPEFSLIRQEQFAKILEHARRIQEATGVNVVKRVIAGLDPRIVLLHDQVILGRSIDNPERMRGHEVDGFWGDEVQRWPYRCFRIAASRLRSAPAIRIAMSCNPEPQPGWVWQAIEGKHKPTNRLRERLKAGGGGYWIFRDWKTTGNPSNRAEVTGPLAEIMAGESSTMAKQEMLGLWPGREITAEGVFNYERAFVGRVVLVESEAMPAVLGVDIGESEDFTWLTVLSKTGVVLYMERWNASSPGVPRKEFFPYLKAKVKAVAAQWKVGRIVIDTAKSGKPICQDLAVETRVDVIDVDTGIPSKKGNAIEACGVAMSSGIVRVPEAWKARHGEKSVEWVDYLKKEWSELVPIERGGHRSFTHPAGAHDDGVVSLSLAFHGLERGTPPGDASGFGAMKIKGPPGPPTPSGGRRFGGFGGIRIR